MVDDHEKRIEAELDQLQKDICRVGSNPGEPSVFFGELFEDEDVEQYYEALVGTLKCAKKRRIISFQGQMLLKGMHDNVVISIVGSDKRSTEEKESVPASSVSDSAPSVKQTPPREPISRRGLKRSDTSKNQTLESSASSCKRAPQLFSSVPDKEDKSERTTNAPATRAKSANARSQPRTPPRTSVVNRPCPRRGTPAADDCDDQRTGDTVAKVELPETQTLPASRRTPPRAPTSKRTPPRWGTHPVSVTGQMSQRPQSSFDPTTPQVEKMEVPPDVRQIIASSHSSLEFSPSRHTRIQHSSLKIPEAFERQHKDYTSDSEAEFSNRRVRKISVAAGASSDTEAEVTTGRLALESRNLSVPSSLGESDSGNCVNKMFPCCRARTKGSVADRWTERTPSRVSEHHQIENSATDIQRRSVTTKTRRASSANEMCSSRSGNCSVVNKENRITMPKSMDCSWEKALARTASPSKNVAGLSKSVAGPAASVSCTSRRKSEAPRPSAVVRDEEDVELLLRDICRVGSSPGEPRVTFGELFDDDTVQNTYGALVGTLRSAKRQGLIRFNGQMLFKGMHDNVMIEIVTK